MNKQYTFSERTFFLVPRCCLTHATFCFIAQSKFHFDPFDSVGCPLTTAIEAELDELDSKTACEQEKISIFESQVELGGLTQNRLLPKKNLLHR